MEIVFRNKELQDLARGIGDHKYPTGIWKKYRFVLQTLRKMKTLEETRDYKGRKKQRKSGDREDQIWIWLNGGWRVMLKYHNGQATVLLVWEVVNYHK